MDFPTALRKSVRQFAGNTAVWYEGSERTYAEVFDRSCRLANGLADLGIMPGDRVALLGPNGLETVEQIAGIALGSFVRTALYAHQTAELNRYLLELVDARALIVHVSMADQLLDAVDRVIVYGGDSPSDRIVSYERLLAESSSADPQLAQASEDLHVIRFSAGTTGRPKGIVHTVSAWLRGGDEFRWVTPRIDERDGYLVAGPLTHAAVVFLWPMLQVGGRIVVMAGFDPGRALELIERQRPSLTLMVPTMIQALVDHPEAGARDLSSLRCLSYAASPISEHTMLRALDLVGEGVLHQWYAQSEAWPLTMLLPHQHRERPRSVGRPTPNTVLTVVDDEGTPVPTGEIGEIAVRTPGRMRELWGDPEGTAARLLPDGSLRTRDMGFLDEEGFVFLADRKEDMIISGGYNIWPAELENAIASHPAVSEVCVVGIPHEYWGETPIAVVVARPGETISESELIELTRARCGSVKKVTAVEVVDELPKSGVGKVLRRQVRERYWAGRPERVAGA